MLDRGQREDWFGSTMIILSFAHDLGDLLRRPGRARAHHLYDPIVRLQLLGNRNFAAAMMVMTTTGFILYGSTQLIPQMLQTVFGYTATNAGLGSHRGRASARC